MCSCLERGGGRGGIGTRLRVESGMDAMVRRNIITYMLVWGKNLTLLVMVIETIEFDDGVYC